MPSYQKKYLYNKESIRRVGWHVMVCWKSIFMRSIYIIYPMLPTGNCIWFFEHHSSEEVTLPSKFYLFLSCKLIYQNSSYHKSTHWNCSWIYIWFLISWLLGTTHQVLTSSRKNVKLFPGRILHIYAGIELKYITTSKTKWKFSRWWGYDERLKRTSSDKTFHRSYAGWAREWHKK